jgi:hypothetical protein
MEHGRLIDVGTLHDLEERHPSFRVSLEKAAAERDASSPPPASEDHDREPAAGDEPGQQEIGASAVKPWKLPSIKSRPKPSLLSVIIVGPRIVMDLPAPF